jgi:hypothetical protein
VQAHTNFEQLERLIARIIRSDDSAVHVHVDRKNEALQGRLAHHYRGYSRVYILTERESVFWGDFSQVKATLLLLGQARLYEYRYYSLLSGQDYPIRPLSEFHRFLQVNDGTEFIEARRRGNTWRILLVHRHTKHPLFRKSRWFRYYALLRSIVNHRKKISLDRLPIYYGSQWFTITSDAVNFIWEFIRDNPVFLKDFETTTCGDEHFFQTILMNSDFKNKISDDNLRYYRFDPRSNSPSILRSEDHDELLDSQKFIARKFDCNFDREILDRLDRAGEL